VVAVITIRYRAGSRDGFKEMGAAPRGTTIPPPAGTSTSHSSTWKASARPSTYHAASIAISLARLPEARLAQRPRLPHPHPGGRRCPRDPLRAADAARGGPEGKGRCRAACATASGRPASAPASPSRTRSASSGWPGWPRRSPPATCRRAGGARSSGYGAGGAGLTPTLAGDAGVSSTQLGKRQPTAGRAAGRPRAGSSSRGGSSLGLGRPDRRS
jgi:hypothetical protein